MIWAKLSVKRTVGGKNVSAVLTVQSGLPDPNVTEVTATSASVQSAINAAELGDEICSNAVDRWLALLVQSSSNGDAEDSGALKDISK